MGIFQNITENKMKNADLEYKEKNEDLRAFQKELNDLSFDISAHEGYNKIKKETEEKWGPHSLKSFLDTTK